MRGLCPGEGAGRTETGYLPTPLGAWFFCPLDGAPSSVMMLWHHSFLASATKQNNARHSRRHLSVHDLENVSRRNGCIPPAMG